jgi:hypothetical protein
LDHGVQGVSDGILDRLIWTQNTTWEVFVMILQSKHLFKVGNTLLVNLDFSNKPYILLVWQNGSLDEQYMVDKITISTVGRLDKLILQVNNMSLFGQ